MDREKNYSIEVLRGVVILLMIVYHVIGSGSDGAMKEHYPSVWRYISDCCGFIIVPLYAAISGWVYAIKDVSVIAPREFIANKFLRLIVPAFTVGTLYFVVQYFTAGTNVTAELSSIWRIYVFPYTIYWFLLSIFLIFVFQYFVDRANVCDSITKYLFILVVALGICYFISFGVVAGTPNVFSYQGALGIYIYFLIGLGVKRFNDFFKPIAKLFGYSSVVLLVALINWIWFYRSGVFGGTIFTLLVPIFTCGIIILLLQLKLNLKLLVWVGGYSYGIYLFHGFGTAGGRIILNAFGITNSTVVFFVSFAVALFCSILAVIIIKKIKIADFLLLGAKWR